MPKYKCPEGDHEQDTPGVCPNHGLDLEMEGEEKEGEEKSEMGEEEEETEEE